MKEQAIRIHVTDGCCHYLRLGGLITGPSMTETTLNWNGQMENQLDLWPYECFSLFRNWPCFRPNCGASFSPPWAAFPNSAEVFTTV